MKKITSLLTRLAILFLPTAFCLLPIFSYAQAPQKFNYQGIARGSAGNVFSNQSLGFKFSILQGSAAGTAVYVEVQAATSDSKGIFSLEVGTGAVVIGVFSSIGWGTDSYWLKTEMDTTGGSNYQVMGTTQMISVPYALYATTASNAGFSNMQVFSTPGTYTFSIPAKISKILVEVWGGGGGGGSSFGWSGGGGGYGKEIFSVTSLTTYTASVGAGGVGGSSGGTSSFGLLISASGGGAGGASIGYGGTSTAAFNISGGNGGASSDPDWLRCGGMGANGGIGGTGDSAPSTNGKAPGGGGGVYSGNGAPGRVVVWY